MKNQIRELIAAGRLEEALKIIAQTNDEGILLLSRYNHGNKEYNMGLVNHADWALVKNQISYAALELADKGTPIDLKKTPARTSPERSIFISYSHHDRDQVDQIRAFLEKEGLAVVMDTDNMAAGEKISDFIQNRLKESGFILSVVSRNSLRSGWVGIESDLAFYAQLFGGRSFLPVYLDNAFLTDDFLFETLDHIDHQLQDLDEKIDKAKSRKISALPFENKRNRLQELRENLPRIIERLQSVLTVDISGDQFETGMRKIVQAVKNGAE